MWTVSFTSLTGILILYLCILPTVEGGFSLPGIFSTAHCQDANNRKLLEPACTCMERAEINDINGLCRNSSNLISCIAEELSKGSNSDSYMQTIFSASHMERSLRYVCNFWKDGSEVKSLQSCGEVAADCEADFMMRLNNTNGHMFTNQSCRMTDLLGRCYWGKLHHCKPRTRHILHQLVDVHITYNCTNQGKSKTGKCFTTAYALHPTLHPQKPGNKEECLAAVDKESACLLRERAHSLHPRDKWYKMEFEIERFRRYQRYMCQVKNRPDYGKCSSLPSDLSKIALKCTDTYETAYNNQVNDIYENIVVTVGDVCRVINKYTSCLRRVYASCPTDSEYFQAKFCAISSCHCAVKLPGGHAAGSTSSFIVITPMAGNLLMLAYITVYCLFY